MSDTTQYTSMVQTSVTQRFLDAANTDAISLATQRSAIESEMVELNDRMSQLRQLHTEVVELQNITLARITQYEKAKING